MLCKFILSKINQMSLYVFKSQCYICDEKLHIPIVQSICSINKC